MEHQPELKEEVEIVEEEGNEPHEVHRSILPHPDPPTRAVSDRCRGRDEGKKTGVAINATLGAMVPLVGKLDMLLAPMRPSSKKLKDAIQFLKEDVEELSSYLDELLELEDPPPTAICWIDEARDLSYDMEDLIHNTYEWIKDPSVVGKTTRVLRKLTSHVQTPKRLVQTISEFRMYVQEAIQRREVYGLSGPGPSSINTLRRRYMSVGPMLPMRYEETADIVIDGRMNAFITSLAEDGDQQLKVVSVFGSACLGKTTLARVWYNKFGKQYNCRAFIRVSKKPDMKRIFLDMVSQLQGQHPPNDYKEINLIDNIKEYLQDKRYLIIIDDLWTASVWNIIKKAFPKGSHGSRIITTTQMEDVALTCCRYESEHVFEMKPLDDDHSKKLFFDRLLGYESYCPPQLKEILTEIVEICGGLPLATVSIASLLASQPVITVDLLTYIYQSISSCFSANSTSERTRQVLNLGYNNLPHHLKTCLLYLSMYPEGSTFYKDDLVKQWMAEILINTTEGQDIKEVATGYLDELIRRRFIQPLCINYNNEIVSCAVHDAVHDLIAHKSAEENFSVAIDYSQMNVALSRKVRRLSLLFGNAIYAKAPENISKTQVRSLTFFGLHECMPCISEFKLLCVLNLQLSDHGGHNDPVDLGDISRLLKLRYLKVASDVCIKLPKHGLQCLQTLDIRDASVAMDRGVPCVPYIHLPNLLHLSLSVCLRNDEINLVKWINSMVSDGKLTYLQDLHVTTHTTSVSYDVKPIMETLMYRIGSRNHNLKTIVVRPGSSVKDVVVHGAYEVLDDIWLQPPPFLQRFEFVTHNPIVFSRIPWSVQKHGNLCSLKIEVRDLEINCVDILRELPALTALSLYVEIAPCQRIIFNEVGFSVLKYFKLRFTSGIAWLNFEADALPNLGKLKLVFDVIPRMDRNLALFSNCPLFEHHKRGTAVISIEHMRGLKEISVKFGGANADVEYALRFGVSNHPRNPTINRQPVNYSINGNERRKMEQQRPDEILVERQYECDQIQQDEFYKQEQDKVLEEETDDYYKQQSDKILEEEPDTRISSSPESYTRLHVPEKLLGGIGFKRRLRCMGWDQEKEPRQPRKQMPKELITKKNLKKPKQESEGRKRKSREDRLQWLRDNQRIDEQSTWLANMGVHAFTMDELFTRDPSSKWSTANILGDSKRAYILGLHGFANPGVYKCSISAASLPPHGGVVLNLGSSYNKTHNWLLEAVYLETKKHPNIVKLVGFCYETLYQLYRNETRYQLLVYEYIVGHSLQYYLDTTTLGAISWSNRLKIAIGSAKGLTFLYEADTPMHYSGDFKASKIMLDSDYTVKLSGFVLPAEDWCRQWNIEKDVYNFGVVLLALLSGQPFINKHRRYIWLALALLENKDELQNFMDKSLEGRYSVRAAWKMVTIARRCCGPSAQNRPRMHEIVDDLENIVGRKLTKKAGGTKKEGGKTKQQDQAEELDVEERKPSWQRKKKENIPGRKIKKAKLILFPGRRFGPRLACLSAKDVEVEKVV